METVSPSFRYAEQDYVRAMRAHYASRLRLPLDIVFIVGLAVVGAYAWRSGSHGFGTAMMSVSGIFALMLVAAFAIIPTISFRSQPNLRDDYSLKVLAAGYPLSDRADRFRPSMEPVHGRIGRCIFLHPLLRLSAIYGYSQTRVPGRLAASGVRAIAGAKRAKPHR